MNTETRQALIELLLFAIYLDNHLSLLEDELLDDALKAIGWSPEKPGGVSITSAFATAREAASNEDGAEEFMKPRISRLKEAGEGMTAYNWLRRLLGSDGVSDSESHFLRRIKSLLFD